MNTSNLVLEILPNRTTVKKNTGLDFMVRLRAPKAPVSNHIKRLPLNIALSIDASGSMNGIPLMEAKKAALAFFNQLHPEDRISLIGYGNIVRTWMEPMFVSDAKTKFHERLNALHDGGGTALHGGWLEAANSIAPFATSDRLSRVIVLSDGQANIGIRDVNVIESNAKQLDEAGISTSTYGLGYNFDEVLMTKLAVGGNAFYASNADDLQSYFQNEFHLLNKIAALRIKTKVEIKDSQGKAISYQLLNQANQKDGKITMSTLVYESDSWLAFHISEKDVQEKLHLEVSTEWTDPASQVVHILHEHTEVKVGAKSSKLNEEVQARCDEARAAQIQAEASDAALRGDFQGAEAALNMMSGMTGSSAYIAGVHQTLKASLTSGNLQEFSKEARYSSVNMNNRLAAQDENPHILEEDKLGFRKAVQGKSTTFSKDSSKEGGAL